MSIVFRPRYCKRSDMDRRAIAPDACSLAMPVPGPKIDCKSMKLNELLPVVV